MKNGTQIRCASGKSTIHNLETTCVLVLASADPGMQSSTYTPFFASNHCGHFFGQEVVALHRISTSGLEIHLYPRGWVKTIKILKI